MNLNSVRLSVPDLPVIYRLCLVWRGPVTWQFAFCEKISSPLGPYDKHKLRRSHVLFLNWAYINNVGVVLVLLPMHVALRNTCRLNVKVDYFMTGVMFSVCLCNLFPITLSVCLCLLSFIFLWQGISLPPAPSAHPCWARLFVCLFVCMTEKWRSRAE